MFFFRNYSKTNYCALVDLSSFRLFVLTDGDLQTLLYLREFVQDSQVILIPVKNYFNKKYLDQLINYSKKEEYIWDNKNKIFKKKDISQPEVLSKLDEKAKLVRYKYTILKKVIDEIESSRNLANKNLLMQSHVEMDKKLEAEKYLIQDKSLSNSFDFPYLSMISEQENTSLDEAAKAVLSESRFKDANLQKTEKLRLKYFALIEKAGSLAELEAVLKEFLLEIDIRI